MSFGGVKEQPVGSGIPPKPSEIATLDDIKEYPPKANENSGL